MIGRGADQFSLRFPEGLRERIKAIASTNRRSMNSEIVSILEDALSEREKEVAEQPAS